MHVYADCSLCGGEVKAAHVELDYRYKGKLHVLRQVPAGVCQQCGEKYVIAAVAKEIERLILSKSQPRKTVRVPLLIYAEKAVAATAV